MWCWYFSSLSQSWKCLSVQTSAAVQVCRDQCFKMLLLTPSQEFQLIHLKLINNLLKIQNYLFHYLVPSKFATWKIFWDWKTLVFHFRQEMQHFVRVMQSYIAHQVIFVTWNEFKASMKTDLNNLDDLIKIHDDYLNRAIFRFEGFSIYLIPM